MPAEKNSDWQHWGLALLPGLLALAFFWFAYLPWSNSEHNSVIAQQLADAKAAQLDNNIQQMVHYLDGMARLPDVRMAMRDNNEELIEALTRDLSRSFTHLDRLALIPLDELGIASLGNHERLLRSNIEKDILRRASNLEDVFVDSYLVDGERVLGLARPVFSGNRSIGAVLLTLRSEWLSNQLIDGEQSVQRHYGLQLSYQVPGAALQTIISHGNTSGGDTQIASLSTNSYFKVLLTQPTQPAASPASLAMLSAIVIAMLLSFILTLRTGKASAAKVETDIARLIVQINGNSAEGNADSGSGEAPAGTTYHYPAFHKLLDATNALALNRAPSAKLSGDESNAGNDENSDAAWANPQVGAEMLVEESADEAGQGKQVDIARHIFRAYDIRGHAEHDLDDESTRLIGMAIGSKALETGCSRMVVGRDGRLSSERLQQALVDGLLATGCDVIDIGLVSTPVLYYAAIELGTNAGVMITGSHNNASDNGFKIMLDGAALADGQVTELLDKILRSDFQTGSGLQTRQDFVDNYIDRITEDVVVASPLKIVLDCCNGAASEIAPLLFASLGCEVIPLFADVDGNFPNHAPDPSQRENLQALIDEVSASGADLGIAFDGDADRMAAVTGSGQCVDADQLLMLFARDVVTRNPGADVVYDVKCSRGLNQVIADQGGRPIMWKSGHSLIKQKMRETGALVGGEFTGHFCFMERWFGFDDGLYSAARLIELLTLEGISLDEAIAQLPSSYSTPELMVAVAEEDKFNLVEQLKQSSLLDSGKCTDLDGIRIDYPDGWGLVRASNTSANLSLRFESQDAEGLAKIQALFKKALLQVAPDIAIDW